MWTEGSHNFHIIMETDVSITRPGLFLSKDRLLRNISTIDLPQDPVEISRVFLRRFLIPLPKNWWNESLCILFRKHVVPLKKVSQYPCPANLDEAIV